MFSHVKVLRQLGQPYHWSASEFQNLAIHHLIKPLDPNSQDAS